jgi:hypothetical protein
MWDDDITLELARTVRECTARAEAKVRAGQLGEAWVGLLAQGLDSPEGEVQADRHAERVAA